MKKFEKYLFLIFFISISISLKYVYTTKTDLPGSSTITHYPSEAIKNSQLILTCNTKYLGKPPANRYIWYSNQMELTNETSNKIHIKVITAQISNFTCAAVNELGNGEFGYIKIPVLAPPKFIQQLPDKFAVSDTATSVNLTCQVECNPSCLVYWLKDKQILTNTDPLYQMKVEFAGPDYKMNVVESVISTLSFNITAWPNGHLNKEVDDAIYTCMSSSNSINRGVTSSTKFHVEYAPENVMLSKKEINVTEWTIFYNITCNSDGSPLPSYKWIYNNQVLSSYKFLYTNPLTRNDSGYYTCVASNIHGNASSDMFVNVMYEPSCEVLVSEDDSKVFITCKVIDANPQDLTYHWIVETVDKILINYTQSEVIDINEEGNLLTFIKDKTNKHRNYGNFTCAVSNFVGESNCTLQLKDTEKEMDANVSPDKKNDALKSEAMVSSATILMLLVLANFQLI